MIRRIARGVPPQQAFPVNRNHQVGAGFLYRELTNSGTSASSSNSSFVKWSEAAATFCSRCSTDDVPGMGNIIGDRCNNHDNAI